MPYCRGHLFESECIKHTKSKRASMNQLFLTTNSETSFAQSSPNPSSTMFSHVRFFPMLRCAMLSNHRGMEYAALCRYNSLSLLVPYRCLGGTLKVLLVGKLELSPAPPSLQACGARGEGAAGPAVSPLGSLEWWLLCLECLSLSPGHQLLTTSSCSPIPCRSFKRSLALLYSTLSAVNLCFQQTPGSQVSGLLRL